MREFLTQRNLSCLCENPHDKLSVFFSLDAWPQVWADS